jgi:hypothetical protein
MHDEIARAQVEERREASAADEAPLNRARSPMTASLSSLETKPS